jgi:tetratricopeptide (TPR) repeat protein
VVSKNLQQQDNLADHYINLLQNNKNRLDTINQTIRKYNQSLMYCREDNEDVAIIQLKKVINQNPKLVKAYQLLALLYMKRQEYERARKLLRKASQIDNTNTTTLRYLQEIEEVTGKGTNLSKRSKKYEKLAEEGTSGTLRYMSGTEMIIQPTTFRDSSTIATFINIILGILLGGAIVWFLIVPANRQSVNDAANRQVTDANTKLASESVKVQELQDQIDDYVTQADRANQDRDEALAKADSYNELLAVANLYVTGDTVNAAQQIGELDADDFDGAAKTLYESITSAVQGSLFDQYYNAGTVAYVAGDYSTAATQLQKAVDNDPERTNANHYNALLYLGMAYFNQGDTTNADNAFNQIVQYYPSQASNIQGYISSSGSTTAQTDAGEALSGLGAGTTGADASAASSGDGTTYDDDTITVYGDDGSTPYVAWTDPNTGLQYDVDGNLIQ